MAIALGIVDHLTLTLTFKDFRGQKTTKKVELGASTSDAVILAIVQAYDNLSNAQIVTAEVSAARTITGMKSAAVSTGHEVNISELMELTLYCTNPINPLKKSARTLGIPAMVSACEQTDGSPIPVTGVGGDTSAAPTTGAALDLYNLLHSYEGSLAVKGADGNWYGPAFVYSPASSHHIGISDIVDSY